MRAASCGLSPFGTAKTRTVEEPETRATEVVSAVSIETAEDELVIRLVDREVRIRWERCSPILAAASAEDRRRAELSPGGCGIHWPTLDEHLSIGGLVGSTLVASALHGTTRAKPATAFTKTDRWNSGDAATTSSAL
jgi:hypothetical protein